MGNDGGSITKQHNLKLRLQKNSENVARDDDYQSFSVSSLWRYCRLTNKPLVLPIVSDYKGHLFNKIAIVEWLLSQDKQIYSEIQQEQLQHIKKLNDVVELHNLKEIKDEPSRSTIQCKFGDDILNENKAFVYLVKCGCVIPSSTLPDRTKKEDKKCCNCGEPYESIDIIPINPTTEKEIDELEERNSKLVELKLHHNGNPRTFKKRHRESNVKMNQAKKQKR